MYDTFSIFTLPLPWHLEHDVAFGSKLLRVIILVFFSNTFCSIIYNIRFKQFLTGETKSEDLYQNFVVLFLRNRQNITEKSKGKDNKSISFNLCNWELYMKFHYVRLSHFEIPKSNLTFRKLSSNALNNWP